MNNNIKIFVVLFFFTNSNYAILNYVKNTTKSVFSIFNNLVVRFPMIKQRDFSSLSTLPKEFSLNSLESQNSIDQKIVNNVDNNVINKNKNYFRVGMPRPVQGSILMSQGIGKISNHKVNSPKKSMNFINKFEFSSGKDINKDAEISKIIQSVEAFRPALVKDLIKHWYYGQETANLFVDFLSNAMVNKNAVHRMNIDILLLLQSILTKQIQYDFVKDSNGLYFKDSSGGWVVVKKNIIDNKKEYIYESNKEQKSEWEESDKYVTIEHRLIQAKVLTEAYLNHDSIDQKVFGDRDRILRNINKFIINMTDVLEDYNRLRYSDLRYSDE